MLDELTQKQAGLQEQRFAADPEDRASLPTGRRFDIALREDRGDVYTDTPESLTLTSGVTGQTIEIVRRAVLSSR